MAKSPEVAPRNREEETLFRRCIQRWGVLENERSSFISHWQSLNDYIFPRRFRGLVTDKNKGSKNHSRIINGCATRAARTLGAGKMAGETSPARPWFRYVSSNLSLMDNYKVSTWCAQVETIVTEALAKSNAYVCLHKLWENQGVFGTAVIYVEADEENDLWCSIVPLGQFCIASGSRKVIDTLFWQSSMTVEQIVKEFGLENVSVSVSEAWKAGRIDDWITILQVIEPNTSRVSGMIDNKNMPYRSLWLEKDAGDTHNKFLRVSGFEERPFMVARWGVEGEDLYGTGCPGMDSLGDIKTLQILAKKHLVGVNTLIEPPLKAPTGSKLSRNSALPGDTTYLDETASGKFETVVDLPPGAVSVVNESIAIHERRIMDTFYATLFLMISMDERTQPSTAREINERHEEKMLQLGPVIEQDQTDVLGPFHNRVVNILARAGKLPPVPEELIGQRIQVVNISIMAQAQKLLGTSATERAVSFVGSLAAVKKEVLDNLNTDEIIRRYCSMLGMAPSDLNPKEVVEAMRQQRSSAEQTTAAMEQSLAAVQGAKVASQTDMSGDTALSRLVNTVGGGQGAI